ncbi:MAG TPA: TonB-dependent receptor [Vicinamibacteria bacterium]|nr:TonB-dependent receptor [Vicinamibacteria bacterium]
MRFARCLPALGLALALVALAPAAWAQISAGNIYGKVTDQQGGALPGATITLTGTTIGARTTTTGSAGEYRFLTLDPGTYTLSVALTGFATTQRSVVVSAGVSIDVNFTTKVAGVAETVTVEGETPVLDTKKTGTGTTVTGDELSKIPNSRDPWAFMRAVPGVQVDRLNQAGSESGQQSGYIGKGSSQTDSMWVLDGVVITDPGAVGSSPTYFDFDTFDEVAITTGGADVRVATGGVGINLVTKRGTNAFHGGASGYFGSHSLEASNLPDSLKGDPRLQGADKADHVDQIGEWGVDVGGPILKDKLWFWGSYGKQDLRIQRLNQSRDRTQLDDYSAKVNWQVASNNMFSAYWLNGVKTKLGRPGYSGYGVGTEDPSHSRDQGQAYENGWPHGFLKVEDNHVFSPNFMLNAKLSHYNTGFSLTPEGGRGGDDGVNQVAGFAYGSANYYQSVRPQDTVNLDASYFHGSHEFKFGFGYRRAAVTSTNAPSGSGVMARTEAARGTVARIQRELVSAYKGNYSSLYAQDTYTSGRLTLTGGVRWDLQHAENKASTAKANPMFPDLLPDLVYDGSGTKIRWSDVSPRVGLTLALDESRKTLLRGNFAIFTSQLPMPDVTAVNPLGGVARLDYGWTDLNGDGFVQQNEVDLAGGLVGVPGNVQLSTVNQIDPNYKAQRDLEFLGGIERELAPNLAVGVTYTYRRTSNPPYVSYVGVNGTDWVSCDPVTSNGYTVPCEDVGPTNAAALDANSFGVILGNRPDYHRTYNGIELTAVKRLSNRWMGRVAFAYNNWTESFDGRAGIQDPLPTLYDTYGYQPWGSTVLTDAKKSGGQMGYDSISSGTPYWVGGKWQLSANALYQIGGGFEVAGSLFARQGYFRPISITIANTFNDTVMATDVGQQRLPDVWNLDLRLAWNRKISGVNLGLMADVFNVFNSSTVLRQNDFADSGAFNSTLQIMSPLLVRFGARLSF